MSPFPLLAILQPELCWTTFHQCTGVPTIVLTTIIIIRIGINSVVQVWKSSRKGNWFVDIYGGKRGGGERAQIYPRSLAPLVLLWMGRVGGKVQGSLPLGSP